MVNKAFVLPSKLISTVSKRQLNKNSINLYRMHCFHSFAICSLIYLFEVVVSQKFPIMCVQLIIGFLLSLWFALRLIFSYVFRFFLFDFHVFTGTKKMEYKTRQWHEKCFSCCVCKNPIGTKSYVATFYYHYFFYYYLLLLCCYTHSKLFAVHTNLITFYTISALYLKSRKSTVLDAMRRNMQPDASNVIRYIHCLLLNSHTFARSFARTQTHTQALDSLPS